MIRCVIAVLALLALGYASGFRLNVTGSLPRGVYRLADGPLHRGDVVGFCLEGAFAELARERGYVASGSCPSGLRPLMKRLAGLPGDQVRLTDEGIVCGPEDKACRWQGVPLTRDGKGRPLARASLHGTVPAGSALVLADHPGSFDSRYFGFVPLDSLVRMEPVFVLERSNHE